ncbi:MAG: hypothetical protein JWR26_4868 [Pedosphaera sp.]|nr:hypothetical protein [Pedosphaera sp.]
MHTKRNLRAVIMACAIIWRLTNPALGGQTLGTPVFGVVPGTAQINLINCDIPYFVYVVQTSSNLQDWVSVATNSAVPSGSPVTVPATNATCFYRLMSRRWPLVPRYGYAIVTTSSINLNGNNCAVDSFDSSNPLYSTNGQYSSMLRKANGDVATDAGLVGDISIGIAHIYGHLYTGPGTALSTVQIGYQVGYGYQGAVGDLAWNAAHTGIESNYWSTNFNMSLPDVAAPTGFGMGLPAATNGHIILPGGNYTTTVGPTVPLVITGPTTLWVQGSFTPGGITIATSNNAYLVLYVGTTNKNGFDSLTIAGNGPLNQPGYAVNLDIMGLPSLTSVSFSGNAGFVGCIYAPEAALSGSGGGNNTLDTMGSMIVKSVTLHSRCNFHYDEALKEGPNF